MSRTSHKHVPSTYNHIFPKGATLVDETVYGVPFNVAHWESLGMPPLSTEHDELTQLVDLDRQYLANQDRAWSDVLHFLGIKTTDENDQPLYHRRGHCVLPNVKRPVGRIQRGQLVDRPAEQVEQYIADSIARHDRVDSGTRAAPYANGHSPSSDVQPRLRTIEQVVVEAQKSPSAPTYQHSNFMRTGSAKPVVDSGSGRHVPSFVTGGGSANAVTPEHPKVHNTSDYLEQLIARCDRRRSGQSDATAPTSALPYQAQLPPAALVPLMQQQPPAVAPHLPPLPMEAPAPPPVQVQPPPTRPLTYLEKAAQDSLREQILRYDALVKVIEASGITHTPLTAEERTHLPTVQRAADDLIKLKSGRGLVANVRRGMKLGNLALWHVNDKVLGLPVSYEPGLAPGLKPKDDLKQRQTQFVTTMNDNMEAVISEIEYDLKYEDMDALGAAKEAAKNLVMVAFDHVLAVSCGDDPRKSTLQTLATSATNQLTLDVQQTAEVKRMEKATSDTTYVAPTTNVEQQFIRSPAALAAELASPPLQQHTAASPTPQSARPTPPPNPKPPQSPPVASSSQSPSSAAVSPSPAKSSLKGRDIHSRMN